MTAVETLTYPDPADALDLASRNADRGALVTLVGTCTVEYEAERPVRWGSVTAM